MIKEFLNRLQELQRDTLGTNIHMDVTTRFTGGKEWLVATAMTEERTEDDEFVGYISVYFDYYTFQSEEENRTRMEGFLNNLVEFINTYSNEN